MTPAEELRTAATTLRKLAAAATPGPWHRPLNTRYKSAVTAALPDGEHGQWTDGIDPGTGERERATVVSVPIWSNGKHARARGGRDLEYAAAMGPTVGLALAKWLDNMAATAQAVAKKHAAAAAEDAHWMAPALAVARAINTPAV